MSEMEPTICLGMMVKHEAQTIKRTIEHCLPFVDHVLVSVDSESEDGTREIVMKIADTVTRHVFTTKKHPHGSFAESRMVVHRKAQELGYDWLLQMDGHEYLTCKDGLTLKKLIQTHPENDLFSVSLMMDGVIVRQPRLYKLNSGIRYSGDIHNFLTGFKNEYYCQSIEIIHDRSDQPKEHVEERSKQRAMMSDKILNERIEKNPKDSRAMFYLAQSYKETGRYEEAIEILKKYLEVSTFIEERWNAYQYMNQCFRALGDTEGATKIIEKGLIEQNRAEGHVILGNEAYDRKEYSQALEHFKNATQCSMPANLVFCNRDHYTWLPHDKISMCYHHMERYLEAINAAGDALQNNPDGNNIPRIGTNISFWCSCIEKN